MTKPWPGSYTTPEPTSWISRVSRRLELVPDGARPLISTLTTAGAIFFRIGANDGNLSGAAAAVPSLAAVPRPIIARVTAKLSPMAAHIRFMGANMRSCRLVESSSSGCAGGVQKRRVNPRLSGVKPTFGIAGLPAFALPDSQAAAPAAFPAGPAGGCQSDRWAMPRPFGRYLYATLAASPGVEGRHQAR